MGDYSLKRIELTQITEPITPGDRVELGFCRKDTAIVQEFLWVRTFSSLHGGKVCLGILESDAKTLALKEGFTITFKPEHVTRIRKGGRSKQ